MRLGPRTTTELPLEPPPWTAKMREHPCVSLEILYVNTGQNTSSCIDLHRMVLEEGALGAERPLEG